MFTTDDHYLIGSAHYREGKPCQDYALSGIHGDVAYAVISDGCSSGRHTDIGSRFMGLSLTSAIVSRVDQGLPLLAVEIAEAQAAALTELRSPAVTHDDLLATCVYAVLTKNGGFAHVRGDGVVALVWVDGSISLHRFDWQYNMPFYPIYLRDGGRAFVAAHGGDEYAPAFLHEAWRYAPEIGYKLMHQSMHNVAEGMDGVIVPIGPIERIRFAAVFSDGVTQVDGVDWKDAVRELLAFKTSSGVFAKRRMIRFVESARKSGEGPVDDLACAVVHVSEERSTS